MKELKEAAFWSLPNNGMHPTHLHEASYESCVGARVPGVMWLLLGKVRMLRFSILMIVMSVVLAASPSAASQDTRPLFSRLQQVILEREPNWTIQRKVSSNSHMSIYLKSGKNRIALMVEILTSDKEAADMFQTWNKELSDPGLQTPMESKHVKSSLPALGDQNYLWTYKSRGASILFQQNSAFVMVTGTSDVAVRRFAQLVSDQLAAT